MPTFFILGADDPEMSAIEALLKRLGMPFGYAITADGVRVHPGNAYKASRHNGDYMIDVGTEVVFVECDIPTAFDAGSVQRVDHHRPGDFGYDKPPADFWAASSLGQIYNWAQIAFRTTTASWPGDEDRLIAAADHCLGHAYAGLCPGIDSDALMHFRATSRAAAQSRDVSAVLADIEATTAILRERRFHCDGCGAYNHPGEQWVCHHCHMTCVSQPAFIVMTDAIHPELPEAACRLGVAYLAKVTEQGGRIKTIVGGNATAAVITNWMIEQKKLDKEVYGSPERGYAGAYDTV